MIRKFLSWIGVAFLCSAIGCRQHADRSSATPVVPGPQKLLDQVVPPQDQMTPALLASDQANILFANRELAFAQQNGNPGNRDTSSGPLSVEEAEEHLQTAGLVLKVDQDRMNTQRDIMNLRMFTVPRYLARSPE